MFQPMTVFQNVTITMLEPTTTSIVVVGSENVGNRPVKGL